jgi:hypothetical protein
LLAAVDGGDDRRMSTFISLTISGHWIGGVASNSLLGSASPSESIMSGISCSTVPT